jgi:acetylornithine/N-succinyldiaminopimelate aminotransferase
VVAVSLTAVNNKSDYLMAKLEDLKEQYDFITDIRGIGLMLGVQLAIDVKSVVNEAIKEGLLIINAGGKTIRIVPPLTVELEDIDLFIEKFNKVLSNY